MRRGFAAILALMLCLSGCGGQPESMNEALDFRAQLLNAGGCSFTAEVAAQYEQYASKFVLQCRYDTETRQTQFEVIAPETVAGITGTVSENRQTVRFDDVALELELLADNKLAPVALPSILAQSWAESYIVSAGSDQDYEAVVYQNGYDQDELKVETWYQYGLPVYTDLWYQGVNEAEVTLSDFKFNT